MKFEQTTGQIIRLCLIGIGITTIAFFLFQQIELLNSTNDVLLDKFILHSGKQQPDKDVMIIERDDKSVAQLGNPIPRNHYAKLIQKLTAFGVKTIVFDLIFLDEMNPDIDSQLARLTDSTRHVIHCFTFSDEELDLSLMQDRRYEKYAIELENEADLNPIFASNATFPHHKFIDSFNKAGFATTEWDYDGRIRKIPLFIEFNGMLYPTLAIAALLDYFGVTEKSVKIEKTFWGRHVVIETSDEIIKIPVNTKGEVLLNFYGLFNVLETIPLYEVINLLDAFQPKDSLKVSLPMFEGKIVLIGTTETGEDKHATPFSAEFPGVGLHATLISNILQNYLINEATWKINFIISAFFNILLLGAFIYYLKFLKSIWSFCLFAIALIIFFNIAAYFLLFEHFRIWLKLLQIDSVYTFLFISLLFYEKVIHLNELNSRITELENDIFIKKTDLEKLDQKISSQTEQYKMIQFFATELQTILNNPSIYQQQEIENFFPKFFENQEIIKVQLEDEIAHLKKEKEKIVREKENLEHEKNIYENIIQGKVLSEPRPSLEKQKINKAKEAQQIMAAWQYFQLQQKKGNSQPSSTFRIVALSTILNEKGKNVKTLMGEIFEKIEKISNYDSTVLITGELGTGKELVAKAIHEQSSRSNKRLVTINCAAIPENLLESVLFGHVKGAFTGAMSDHQGAFEYADGGTIFLDEIGELKLDLQAKLLRVLQNNEFQRVGSNKMLQADVRIIAATNKDLKKCIENNKFRSDLYSRLNVVDLQIPPLRQRKYDIPFLIQHFLNKFNTKYDKEKSFSSEAIIAAMCYDWPDNIRMLQHLVEKVCVLTIDDEIALSALPDEIQKAYRNIFESDEVPWWNQIEKTVYHEQQRLLVICKKAIKENNIEQFLKSAHLQADHKPKPNCYEYFRAFVNGMASIFSTDRRETLIRKTIVQIQEQLFQWCREEKVAKLSELYDMIEKMLGRSRRQIDNWRKE